jgi:hypothetical protein
VFTNLPRKTLLLEVSNNETILHDESVKGENSVHLNITVVRLHKTLLFLLALINGMPQR